MNKWKIEWSFFPERDGEAEDWSTEYADARTLGEAISQFAWRQTTDTDKTVYVKATLMGSYPEASDADD